MSLNNLSDKHFDTNERQQAFALLQQLQMILTPKMTQLTIDERRRYGSVNESNKQIINKVKDYYSLDPHGCAPEINWQEFLADYEDRNFLETFLMGLESLVHELQSTKILHDHDNYQDALADYAYTQYRAERGILGAAQKVSELKQFFSRTGTASSEEEEEETLD